MTHHTPDLITRLPLELSGEVFRFCIASSDVFNAPGSLRSPLRLTWVCPGWRKLAHATPMIWSSLALRKADSYKRSYIPLVKSWLARSSALPLSVALHVQGFTYEDPESAIKTIRMAHRVLDLVILHARHIRTLQANLPLDFYESSGWLKLAGNLHELHSLYLGSVKHADSASLIRVPQLRMLRMRWDSNSLRCIPWDRLVCLDITLDAQEQFLEILRSCAMLKALKVSISTQWNYTTSMKSNPIATPPHLTQFVVATMESDVLGSLLDVCSFLNMETFGVECIWYRHAERGALTRFLDRCNSGLTLTRLTLSFLHIDQSPHVVIREILQRTPKLESITLLVKAVDYIPLPILTLGTPDAQPLVPLLRQLILENHCYESRIFECRYLLNMIRSRRTVVSSSEISNQSSPWPSNSQLDVVRFTVRHRIDQDSLDQLKAIFPGGLQCHEQLDDQPHAPYDERYRYLYTYTNEQSYRSASGTRSWYTDHWPAPL